MPTPESLSREGQQDFQLDAAANHEPEQLQEHHDLYPMTYVNQTIRLRGFQPESASGVCKTIYRALGLIKDDDE